MKKYFFSVITLTDILASEADEKDKNVERLQLTIYFFNKPIKKLLSFEKINNFGNLVIDLMQWLESNIIDNSRSLISD